MKKLSLIFVLFALFLAVSCGGPVKYEDSPEGQGHTDEPEERGALGGECYENRTCNSGLVCDEESNTCMKEPEPTDTGDTTEPTDTGDTAEPTDTGDTTEPTDTGDTTEPTDTGDTTEPTDTGDTTEPTDTGDTTEPTDTGTKEACYSIYDCYTHCNDEACAQACYDNGTPEGQSIFITMYDCWVNNCVNAQTSDEYSECIAYNCYEESEACGISFSENEICEAAGGTYDYFAEDDFERCYQIKDCAPKPANTEWRGDQSYIEYFDFDDGLWTNFGANYKTEYGDTGEAKICQFVCAVGYEWNGTACTVTLPVCNAQTTSFPCKDPSTTYIWSEKYGGLKWQAAVDHCNSLNSSNYGGFSSGWHLPTISELRTLVKNCSDTQMPGGSCGVRDDDEVVCLSSSCQGADCYTCPYDSTGGHSKFGETGYFWSSSAKSGSSGYAWLVLFSHGTVHDSGKSVENDIHCVR